MVNNKNYKIIGWGLAGSVMAWKMWLKKIPFSIYDSGENHSSTVAAGLINPIVFKRLTKSWQADFLIDASTKFYGEISEILKYKITSEIPIARIFSSLEEQNDWAVLNGDKRFEKYIELPGSLHHSNVKAPFGVGRVKSLGNINVKLFLAQSKEYFLDHGVLFQNNKFDYEIDTDLNYVFCEGFDIAKNPFFRYLPMKPTHGDVLTIRSKDLKLEEVLNKNMFILPLGDDLYKVGATYNWELSEAIPTDQGKKELIEKLTSFSDFNFKIVEHTAGIRPTVSDRRPLLGVHPDRSNLFVFNGLGTKGVMIAPLYADKMLDFMLNSVALDEEVDIKRYVEHYNA